MQPRTGNDVNNEVSMAEKSVHISKWQVFIYMFFIPLLFTITITIALGSALNIFDFSEQLNSAQMWLHNLPVVGVWIPEPEPLPLSPEEQIWKEIEDAWAEIEAESARLDAKARELYDRETELASTTATVNAMRQMQLSRDELINGLVERYSVMKAENAGRIFDEMAEEAAVEIIVKMSADKASKIMQAMDPVKAARVTELIRR